MEPIMPTSIESYKLESKSISIKSATAFKSAKLPNNLKK